MAERRGEKHENTVTNSIPGGCQSHIFLTPIPVHVFATMSGFRSTRTLSRFNKFIFVPKLTSHPCALCICSPPPAIAVTDSHLAGP